MVDIKNSSNKTIGYVDIKDNEIIIHNNSKPEYVIKDDEILLALKNNNRSDDIIKKLYDKYYLTIGEIAALYNVCYSNINKQTRQINFSTAKKEGRRNSSYGKELSAIRKQHISDSLKEGYKNGTIRKSHYERTPEIREKISNSLKKYFKKNPQNPLPHINNWKNGIYDNVDFHIGIGGNFYSYKNQKIIRFRSLLELYYFLQLEKDNNITKYEYEAIKITCDNGHIYTPDVLIDDKKIIELKCKKYVEKVAGVLEAVLYKKEQAEKYCLKNNLTYQIIYDTDLDYESTKFKRFLNNNPEIMNHYKISINQPERMVVK